MASKVLVSVIMPAYNSSETIKAAIFSVFNQSFTNFELIVVDDCSTDGTAALVREIAESYDCLRLIVCSSNSGGPARPRNVGIQNSKGRYLAFLDSDDKWYSDKLYCQVGFMQATKAAISCTEYDVVNNFGYKVGRFCPPAIASYDDLLAENSLGCLTVMIDSWKIANVRFPECGHEDYALWLKISRDGWPVHSLQKCLASYTLAPGSVSSNKFKVLFYFWNIYRRQEGFSPIKSIVYCTRYAWNTRRKYLTGGQQ